MLQSFLFSAAVLAALLQLTQAPALAQQSDAPNNSAQAPAPQATPDEVDILVQPREVASPPPIPPIKHKINIPNFASCQISELRKLVPDLNHLEPASDQAELTALLDKIGARMIDVISKTPNLIARESVVSDQGRFRSHKTYSYLILPHTRGVNTIFYEFRVDLATGKKFEMEDIEGAGTASASSELELSSQSFTNLKSREAPSSQGFATGWLKFYPTNRFESDFRYLGHQKMDGHETVVIAFSQKPSLVRLPGRVTVGAGIFPMFMQGIAWVDAADFRIVRLQTDLLSPVPEVDLRQSTADIRFAEMRIADVASPIWLARAVVVTTNFGGVIAHENHIYSDYRLFRAHAKILLSP